NRPASELEITNTLALLAEVDEDNSVVSNDLSTLEVKLAPSIAKLNVDREEAIVHAKTNLAIYAEMTATLQPELEKRHQNEIALTKRELTEYEKSIPVQAALLETKGNPAEAKTVWTPVEVKKLTNKRKIKLTKKDDGSILASGGKGPVDYVINASSALTNITGVMIEVLPDDSLPEYGPGRAGNGNFVLTELELKWGAGTNAPNTFGKFVDARADFSQQSFDVKQAIDGVTSGVNGWAIAGATGPMRHTATFKLEKPITDSKAISLRFTLKQQFDPEHIIGKFRISVTTAADPLDFGFPENVVKAARAPAGQRTAEQSAAIIELVRNSDPELWKRKGAFAKVSAPLPEDLKLAELKAGLKNAEQPIHLDPVLVQLRVDAKASNKQSENKRLTVVQDLTWALINSPGFLFNH
ncbi:MAG: repeat-containing protein, partial [Verrucomicrobiales bacterium]|nr:repeat-containing protein [Verrucomicrobiales bacterium]